MKKILGFFFENRKLLYTGNQNDNKRKWENNMKGHIV